MLIALSALALFAAVVLLVLGIDPVPTWFYVFAWYPTLVLLDATAHRLDGRELVLRDPRRVLSLCGWSAVIWLVFEVANFRLDNWYYVFLPRNGSERWAGILLSFATVVPAVLLSERALDAGGIARRWRTRPFLLRDRDLIGSVVLGLAQLALALAWPNTFFPLVWGAMWLLAEPYVYHRRPDLSLFADLSRGEWGRTVRLLLGGLGIGLLWESYNYWARGKWVYTVPWLEGTKWFEMPPFGFVGFAFFALEAWAMYHALCALGVALPLGSESLHQERSRFSWLRTATAVVLAAGFSVLTLLGMERWTISSVVPRLADLSNISAAQISALEQQGVLTPFDLAATDASMPDTVTSTVQLALLRGIGADHARELQASRVHDVCALASRDPVELWTSLHRNDPDKRPTLAEVRVWVSGARGAC